ncbi:hypothetical protein ACADC178_1984 [Lactobacillus delbrueckii subsp. lactis]|nr:hypothetical protein LDI10_09275 [Lactobacillus delbrueckii subsp. indicus]OFS73827.1 hypothetical protein HMPREF3168_08265 [Lactobacillus sp. HMSC08B12]SUY98679.1 hypothetical protein ACADC178_1984 [Lactobacillus delbrueckii subsp. lactis]
MYTESGLLTTTLRLVEKKLNLPTTIRQIILKLVATTLLFGLHFMMAVMFQEATGTRVIKDK